MCDPINSFQRGDFFSVRTAFVLKLRLFPALWIEGLTFPDASGQQNKNRTRVSEPLKGFNCL